MPTHQVGSLDSWLGIPYGSCAIGVPAFLFRHGQSATRGRSFRNGPQRLTSTAEDTAASLSFVTLSDQRPIDQGLVGQLATATRAQATEQANAAPLPGDHQLDEYFVSSRTATSPRRKSLLSQQLRTAAASLPLATHLQRSAGSESDGAPNFCPSSKHITAAACNAEQCPRSPAEAPSAQIMPDPATATLVAFCEALPESCDPTLRTTISLKGANGRTALRERRWGGGRDGDAAFQPDASGPLAGAGMPASAAAYSGCHGYGGGGGDVTLLPCRTASGGKQLQFLGSADLDGRSSACGGCGSLAYSSSAGGCYSSGSNVLHYCRDGDGDGDGGGRSYSGKLDLHPLARSLATAAAADSGDDIMSPTPTAMALAAAADALKFRVPEKGRQVPQCAEAFQPPTTNTTTTTTTTTMSAVTAIGTAAVADDSCGASGGDAAGAAAAADRAAEGCGDNDSDCGSRVCSFTDLVSFPPSSLCPTSKGGCIQAVQAAAAAHLAAAGVLQATPAPADATPCRPDAVAAAAAAVAAAAAPPSLLSPPVLSSTAPLLLPKSPCGGCGGGGLLVASTPPVPPSTAAIAAAVAQLLDLGCIGSGAIREPAGDLQKVSGSGGAFTSAPATSRAAAAPPPNEERRGTAGSEAGSEAEGAARRREQGRPLERRGRRCGDSDGDLLAGGLGEKGGKGNFLSRRDCGSLGGSRGVSFASLFSTELVLSPGGSGGGDGDNAAAAGARAQPPYDDASRLQHSMSCGSISDGNGDGDGWGTEAGRGGSGSGGGRHGGETAVVAIDAALRVAVNARRSFDVSKALSRARGAAGVSSGAGWRGGSIHGLLDAGGADVPPYMFEGTVRRGLPRRAMPLLTRTVSEPVSEAMLLRALLDSDDIGEGIAATVAASDAARR